MVTRRASNLMSTAQLDVALEAFLSECEYSHSLIEYEGTHMDACEWLKLAEALHINPDALALADVEEEKASLRLDSDVAETLRLICIEVRDV